MFKNTTQAYIYKPNNFKMITYEVKV
jgi:hypothetical protein